MRINRAAIKSNARLTMGGNSPQVYLVTLVLLIGLYALSLLSMGAAGWWEIVEYSEYIYDVDDMLYVLESVGGYSRWGILLSFAISIMNSMLGAGYIIYSLNLCRRRPASFGNLLDPFGMFFRVIGLFIIQGIFIWLWSLLFIIPGIIASYRYRMAIYLLIERPEMSIMDCIRESKRIMRGRKGELFVMDLSFIGWRLLETIPFVSVYVAPYTALSYANYYIAVTADDTDSDQRQDYAPPWEY